MTNESVGRIIFALSFNRARLDATFFPSTIENVLVSYFYLIRKTPQSVETAMKLLGRIRKKSKLVFIDSGVFTMKAKLMGASVSGKLGGVAPDKLAAMNKEIRKKKDYFIEFARGYGEFLAEHDNLFDYAFDLDVDQFLGVGVADKLYEYLCKKAVSPEKIIRIWHSTRTFDDWKEWCEGGRYSYLAVEGGGSHGRDPDFYRRFVDKAHKHNIKVHILAATEPQLLRRVEFDTADSSSWTIGSRYGVILTPFGLISFGTGKGRVHLHWDRLGSGMQDKVTNWLRENDLEYRPDVLQASWVAREFVNIAYFLSIDKHYNRETATRLNFLDQ